MPEETRRDEEHSEPAAGTVVAVAETSEAAEEPDAGTVTLAAGESDAGTVTTDATPDGPPDDADEERPAAAEDEAGGVSRWKGEARKAFAARDAARKKVREIETEFAAERARLEAELVTERKHSEELAAERERAAEMARAIELALEARMGRIRPERRSLVPEGLSPAVRLAYIDRHEPFLFARAKVPPQGGAKPSGDAAARAFREMGAAERAEMLRTEPERYRSMADAEQERVRREAAPKPGRG